MRGKTHRTTRLHGPHALTGGDLGESFAIILVRTGPYGAWLRHPAIQRARDSGHAAPQAPRARDELAPLWLCRAFQGSQTFHKGTREILLNLVFSVQNSLVRASSSLLLYLAQVNPAGTEFTRLSSTVLKRKPLTCGFPNIPARMKEQMQLHKPQKIPMWDSNSVLRSEMVEHDSDDACKKRYL